MKTIKFLTFIFLVITPSFIFAGEAENSANAVITLLDWIFDIWSMLIWLFSILAWALITPEFITWEVFGMDQVMRNIWVLVSNIVYLIFGMIIVFVAFMNIISMEWENYNLKTALPKIIIWVLIVPFSFFIVQFVISVSSILSASIMQLPQTSFWVETWPIQSKEICTSHEIVYTWWTESSWFCSDEEDSYKTIWDILNQWPFGLISIYTYDIFSFDKFIKVWQVWGYTTVWDLTSLWINLLFKMVFFIAYILLIAALILALFVRLIWLWLYVMFSPLFGLVFFFWKEASWIVETFNFKDFIGLAMIPVYVSWALSFWIYFVKAVDQSMIAWELRSIEENRELANSWEAYSCQPAKGFHITVSQPWWDSESTKQSICYWWRTLMTVHGDILWDASDEWAWPVWSLLINALALFIVWMSLMIPLKSSQFTWWIVEPISNLWTNIWTFVAQSPKHLPIIPWVLPSLKALENASNAPSAALASKNAQDAMPVRNFFENLNNSSDVDDSLNTYKQTWTYAWAEAYRKMQSTFEQLLRDKWISQDWVKDIIKQHAKNAYDNDNILNEIWVAKNRAKQEPRIIATRWDELLLWMLDKFKSSNNSFKAPAIWMFNHADYVSTLDEWTYKWSGINVINMEWGENWVVEHDTNMSYNKETWRYDIASFIKDWSWWWDVRRTYFVASKALRDAKDTSWFIKWWNIPYAEIKKFKDLKSALSSKFNNKEDIKIIFSEIIKNSNSWLSESDREEIVDKIIDDIK